MKFIQNSLSLCVLYFIVYRKWSPIIIEKVLIPLFYELAWLSYKPPLPRHTPDHADANVATLH
jgi:hypothetical protein